MHVSHARRALVVAALFVVAGCGGASSTSAPLMGLGSTAQTQSLQGTAGQTSLQGRAIVPSSSFIHAGIAYLPRMSQSAKRSGFHPNYATNKPLVFEADQELAATNVYTASGLKTNAAAIASIPMPVGCPYGMAASKTTLYVATNCGGNTIEEFAAGSTTPSGSITDGISNPLGVALDSKGNLYVSNYPGAITIYPPGASSPSTTITGQGLTDPFGLAVDANNDLFIADFGADQVFEVAAGTTTVTPLNLQDMTEPIGVAIDPKNGDLWVTDGEGDRVQVYAAGATTPTQTITAGYSYPYAISIYKKGSVVVSNIDSPVSFQAYKKNSYTSYATVTNGVELPTGLLWAKL